MKKDVVFLLKDLAAKHNISLRELARLSDIEPSIINKLSNNKHQKVFIPHIARIADALDLDDMNEIMRIIDIEEDEEY